MAYSGHVVTTDCAAYTSGRSDQEQGLQEDLAKQHIAQLSARAKEMENALEEWKNEVNESRRDFYELNYYTTRQLLQLRRHLGLSRLNPHKQIEPEVLALLQSISPAVTSESVHSVLTDLDKLVDKVDLQTAASLVPEPQEMYEDEMETHLSDSEMPPLEAEKLDAHLVENLPKSPISMQPPSSSGVAKPQLTEQDLTDVQKQILADLVEYQGYRKLLVLKAFEECDEAANIYDITDWCEENEDMKFDGDREGEAEDDDVTDSSESSSESDSSDEEDNDLSVSLQQQQSPKGIIISCMYHRGPYIAGMHCPKALIGDIDQHF